MTTPKSIVTVTKKDRAMAVKYAKAMNMSAKTIAKFESGKADTENLLQTLASYREELEKESILKADGFKDKYQSMVNENVLINKEINNLNSAILNINSIVKNKIFIRKHIRAICDSVHTYPDKE